MTETLTPIGHTELREGDEVEIVARGRVRLMGEGWVGITFVPAEGPSAFTPADIASMRISRIDRPEPVSLARVMELVRDLSKMRHGSIEFAGALGTLCGEMDKYDAQNAPADAAKPASAIASTGGKG